VRAGRPTSSRRRHSSRTSFSRQNTASSMTASWAIYLSTNDLQRTGRS
jgi:hypothetical protein